MAAILAVLFLAAAVLVHGAAFTSHIRWLDTQGLTLLGLLCIAIHLALAWLAPRRARGQN